MISYKFWNLYNKITRIKDEPVLKTTTSYIY